MPLYEQLFTHTSDELFQKFTISDIELMQNSLQKEIDKKKDELRVLVGEKYRDFIEIIGKISVMNELAVNITNRIESVSSDTNDLNSKLENLTLGEVNRNSRNKHKTEYSIGILIKLLFDIEDQIWSDVTCNKFLLATELLQLAVHIKTVLNLETTWHVDGNFPVIHELWNSILRFPVVLINLIEEKLKSNDLTAEVGTEQIIVLNSLFYRKLFFSNNNLTGESENDTSKSFFQHFTGEMKNVLSLLDGSCLSAFSPKLFNEKVEKMFHILMIVEMASECLCSLTILENLTCLDVVKRFLDLRIEALKTTFSSENITQNVRARILSSYRIIINTYDVLYHCFKNSPHDNGLFWIQMEEITSLQNSPVLNFVKFDNTSMYGKIHIPTIVQNFRVKMTNQLVPLEATVYHECVNEWLSWVRNHSAQHIRNLLNLIGSLKTLHLLQESVPPLPKQWSVILEYFNQGKILNLWNELYEPVILEQAKILLLHQWNTVFDRVEAEINSIMKKIIENPIKEPEDNLHWFLWDSLEDDVSVHSKENIDLNIAKDLTIKSLGLSPNSGKLCVFLESLISNMVNELSNMNSGKVLDSEQSRILKHHQQSCCLQLVEKLVKHVQKIAKSSTISDAVLIFLARFLSGISPLCSSMKQCIILIDEKGGEWLSVNESLEEESLNAWNMWSIRITSKILTEYESNITNINIPSFRMKHIPKWDSIIIKQKNVDGIDVESEIKVPFQASFPIQNLLNSLASTIGCTLPPRIITEGMINNVLPKVLQIITQPRTDSVHQIVFVQFLFDVKYLHTLLIPIENDLLTTQCNDAISKIESEIDPVDLESIISYLSENVNQFTFKTQGLYGLLMNNKPRINFDPYADNSDDPLVAYNGSTNAPWFPLLPVPTMYPYEKK